jgi:hypothetical protein
MLLLLLLSSLPVALLHAIPMLSKAHSHAPNTHRACTQPARSLRYGMAGMPMGFPMMPGYSFDPSASESHFRAMGGGFQQDVGGYGGRGDVFSGQTRDSTQVCTHPALRSPPNCARSHRVLARISFPARVHSRHGCVPTLHLTRTYALLHLHQLPRFTHSPVRARMLAFTLTVLLYLAHLQAPQPSHQSSYSSNGRSEGKFGGEMHGGGRPGRGGRSQHHQQQQHQQSDGSASLQSHGGPVGVGAQMQGFAPGMMMGGMPGMLPYPQAYYPNAGMPYQMPGQGFPQGGQGSSKYMQGFGFPQQFAPQQGGPYAGAGGVGGGGGGGANGSVSAAPSYDGSQGYDGRSGGHGGSKQQQPAESSTSGVYGAGYGASYSGMSLADNSGMGA